MSFMASRGGSGGGSSNTDNADNADSGNDEDMTPWKRRKMAHDGSAHQKPEGARSADDALLQPS